MAMAKCCARSSIPPIPASNFSVETRSACAVEFVGCWRGSAAPSTVFRSSNGPKRINVWRCQSKFARGVRCEAGSGTVSTTTPTEWFQRTVDLPSFKRGCHIITQHINRAIPEISQYHVGIAHIFVMHTSASLTINENASSDVPLDMEDSLNRIVPEGHHYRHLDEGLDDMPAHVKASMMGSSLTIPIKSGRLHLGIWQYDTAVVLIPGLERAFGSMSIGIMEAPEASASQSKDKNVQMEGHTDKLKLSYRSGHRRLLLEMLLHTEGVESLFLSTDHLKCTRSTCTFLFSRHCGSNFIYTNA